MKRKDQSRSRAWMRGTLAVVLVLLLGVASEAFAGRNSSEKVLVLYDSAGEYSDVGLSDAIMLQNLLGHFNLDITMKEVSEYNSGDMANKKAVFYLGTTFNELSYYTAGTDEYESYQAFLNDTLETEKPVVWINYNLWLLADAMAEAGGDFAGQFGFSYYAAVSNGYNRVTYKDTDLYKGVVAYANVGADLTGCTSEGDNAYACATEINQINIENSEMVTVHATTYSSLDSTVEAEPYIIQSDNFWFVADIPFSYFSEEDRYLAFADILHDILGSEETEQHHALIRLEDVSGASDLEALQAVTDYLVSKNIPFSVATIPYFYDGESWTNLAGSEVGSHLKSLYRSKYDRNTRVASIVAHGKTHQSDYANNPFDKVSGTDFEFYRVTVNSDNSLNFEGPMPDDSKIWAYRRMRDAYWQLYLSGLKAFAWEVPHYTGSSNSYAGVLGLYPIHYGRMTYFVGEEETDEDEIIWPIFHNHHWQKNSSSSSSSSSSSDSSDGETITSVKMLGQFFPYPIYKDRYGYKVVPEDLGYYEPEPITGYRALYPEDLIRHAQKALVVRDGYASFFYHPDLGVDGLKEIVEGIEALGYDFVSGESVF